MTFANDANAAACGEFWVGAGREYDSLILLTLGTGVGVGIIIGELNVECAHSHGSECGHMIVKPSETARICPCGQPGHLEAYCSAKSLVARAEGAIELVMETARATQVSPIRPRPLPARPAGRRDPSARGRSGPAWSPRAGPPRPP
ncbi:MAG: ROK family protein [Pirellulales bacterium]